MKSKINEFQKGSSLFKAYQNHDNFVQRVQQLENTIPEYEQRMIQMQQKLEDKQLQIDSHLEDVNNDHGNKIQFLEDKVKML